MSLRVTKRGHEYDTEDVLNPCNYFEHKDSCKGKKGYFANTLKELDEQIDNNKTSYLHGVDEDSELLFESNLDVENDSSFLFLPAEKVKHRKYKIELTEDELKSVILGLSGDIDEYHPSDIDLKLKVLVDNIEKQWDAQDVHE